MNKWKKLMLVVLISVPLATLWGCAIKKELNKPRVKPETVGYSDTVTNKYVA